MEILIDNSYWMAYNSYLAILPVIFSLFLFRFSNKFFAAAVGFLWFLYLPNSIYIFTDFKHLIDQWAKVSYLIKPLLLSQYLLFEAIGLISFLIAYYPIEILLRKIKISEVNIVKILIGFNFVIGFAMVLGRIERVNSWDAVLNPVWVVTSTIHTLGSYQMVVLSILFGLFTNFFYFLFREKAKKLYYKFKNLLGNHMTVEKD